MNPRRANILNLLVGADTETRFRATQKAVELLRSFLIPGKRIEDIRPGKAWKFMETALGNRAHLESITASLALHAHFNQRSTLTNPDPSGLVADLFSWPFYESSLERFEREILQTLNPTPTPTTP